MATYDAESVAIMMSSLLIQLVLVFNGISLGSNICIRSCGRSTTKACTRAIASSTILFACRSPSRALLCAIKSRSRKFDGIAFQHFVIIAASFCMFVLLSSMVLSSVKPTKRWVSSLDLSSLKTCSSAWLGFGTCPVCFAGCGASISRMR